MRNPDQQRSRRFNSEKNAKSFSETVKGKFKDLKSNENRKSDFKVTYTKENAHKGMKNID